MRRRDMCSTSSNTVGPSHERYGDPVDGLAMGESPRWHENRLWFSDWGAREIVAVDRDGAREVVVRTPFDFPFCIDWLPDGRLLIVSGREGCLLRRELDGSLVTRVDLRGLQTRTRLSWTAAATPT